MKLRWSEDATAFLLALLVLATAGGTAAATVTSGSAWAGLAVFAAGCAVIAACWRWLP